MTAIEFKEYAIDVLKYCLRETKRTANQDGMEDDIETIAYCEGLEDAIDKISKICPIKI